VSPKLGLQGRQAARVQTESKRHFWAKVYYVNTVGRNEEEIKNCIKNQVEADQIEDNVKRLS